RWRVDVSRPADRHRTATPLTWAGPEGTVGGSEGEGREHVPATVAPGAGVVTSDRRRNHLVPASPSHPHSNAHTIYSRARVDVAGLPASTGRTRPWQSRGLPMPKRRREAEWRSAEYRNIALSEDGGVLELRLHFDGGPLQWSSRVHEELGDAFYKIA